MEDVFRLEPRTQVNRTDSYIVSYPHILSYFSGRVSFDAADLVRGAHMVYGWMPTIVELHVGSPSLDLSVGGELLTKAKIEGSLTDAELASLASLVNHSLVGASKLLHFVAPDRFAIWDSKIFAFVFGQRPHNYRVNRIPSYRAYLEALRRARADARFPQFRSSVNTKVGYDVSPLRAIELVMFLNAPDVRTERLQPPGVR